MIRRETTVLHIVENSILFHLRPLRHPDIIDAVHHLGIRLEAVVSTFRTITRLLAQVSNRPSDASVTIGSSVGTALKSPVAKTVASVPAICLIRAISSLEDSRRATFP